MNDMNEVKAYVRRERVEGVVRALHDAGVAHMAVTHVESLGSLVDPAIVRVSMEAGTRYMEHAKIEFVCEARDTDRFIELIRGQAYTGERGDGIISVTPVDRVMRISTGEEAPDALA